MVFFHKLSQKINGTVNLQEANCFEVDVKLQHAIKIWTQRHSKKGYEVSNNNEFSCRSVKKKESQVLGHLAADQVIIIYD